TLLLRPRLQPPALADVERRLHEIDLEFPGELPADLLVFFHETTLRELCALRAWLLAAEAKGQVDPVDDWIRMVTVNRLTGHSPGFLSVYTLPPTQAVSVSSQRRINEKRNQRPPRRDLRAVVLRKSRALLLRLTADERARLAAAAAQSRLLTQAADATQQLPA